MRNKHIGHSFDDFLSENNLLADCQAEAIKRVFSWQLKQFMEKESLSKTELAKQLNTSRSNLERLLDPKNISINLKTLAHAAEVMGKRFDFRLV